MAVARLKSLSARMKALGGELSATRPGFVKYNYGQKYFYLFI
jgi:hypothetical protein